MDPNFITDFLRYSSFGKIILNISKCAVAYGFVTIYTMYVMPYQRSIQPCSGYSVRTWTRFMSYTWKKYERLQGKE